MVYMGSFDEKSPFVYTAALLFDETLNKMEVSFEIGWIKP